MSLFTAFSAFDFRQHSFEMESSRILWTKQSVDPIKRCLPLTCRSMLVSLLGRRLRWKVARGACWSSDTWRRRVFEEEKSWTLANPAKADSLRCMFSSTRSGQKVQPSTQLNISKLNSNYRIAWWLAFLVGISVTAVSVTSNPPWHSHYRVIESKASTSFDAKWRFVMSDRTDWMHIWGWTINHFYGGKWFHEAFFSMSTNHVCYKTHVISVDLDEVYSRTLVW